MTSLGARNCWLPFLLFVLVISNLGCQEAATTDEESSAASPGWVRSPVDTREEIVDEENDETIFNEDLPEEFSIIAPLTVINTPEFEAEWTRPKDLKDYDIILGSSEKCATSPLAVFPDYKKQKLPLGPLDDGIYFLCIQAITKEKLKMATNSPYIFTIDTVPPGEFSLTEIASPTSQSELTVTWSESADAVSYEISISESDSCEEPLETQSFETVTEAIFVIDLDGSYFVCATSTDIAGNKTTVSNQGMNVVIDTSIPQIIDVSTTKDDGSYKQGEQISIQVKYSEAVFFSPLNQQSASLKLETGTNDRLASYVSGHGTDTLTFSYTIQNGDTSADLEVHNDTPQITLPANVKITDHVGNNTDIGSTYINQLWLSESSALIIDTLSPSVISIDSSNTNGSYKVGELIEVELNFNESVFVSGGNPSIVLNIQNTQRSATYLRGSGSETLVFGYTILAGDYQNDLDIAADSNSINLLGASILDHANNAATLSLPISPALGSLAVRSEIEIDGVLPTVNVGADLLVNSASTISPIATDNYELSSYSWTQISGDGDLQFSDPTESESEVSADEDGEYTLRFTAYDLAGNANYDELNFIWDTTEPLVNLGADVTTNSSHTTNSTTSDLNGIETFTWSKISGPGNINFTAATSANTSISADTDGTYVIRLTIVDSAGNSAFDEINFIWDTTPPEAPPALQIQAASFRNNLEWNLSSGSTIGYIVARRTASPVDFTPTDGVDYQVGGIDLNNRIVYKGSSESYDGYGLQTSSVYHYAVFAYDALYNYSAASTANATPLGSDNLGSSTPHKIAVGYNSSGNGHQTCALMANSHLKCWGYDDDGALGRAATNDESLGDETNEMGDDLLALDLGEHTKIQDFHYGSDRGCIITSLGSIKCWGSVAATDSCNLGYGDTLSRGYTANSMGSNLPNIDLGTDEKFKTIGGTAGNFCAITLENKLKCWGCNSLSGALYGYGDSSARGHNSGSMGDNLGFVDLGTNQFPMEISRSDNDSICVILQNRKIKCWGDNSFGHLGYGDTTTRGGLTNQMGDDLPFVDLGTDAAVWKISGNGGNPTLKFNCALLLNGQIKCWGANTDGNLGYGDTIQRGDQSDEMGADLPNIDLGTNKRAIDLAVGNRFVCALLSGGNQVCWGYNIAGSHGNSVIEAIGDEADEMGDNLAQVDFGVGSIRPTKIFAGWSSCAMLSDGSLKCFGDNSAGLLGYGDMLTRQVPADFSAMNLGTETAGTIELAAFNEHRCMLSGSHQVKCFGQGGAKLGYGDSISRGLDVSQLSDQLPILNLGTNLRAKQISAGAEHTCAVDQLGEAKCWGQGDRLGLGDTISRGDNSNEMDDSLPYLNFGANLKVRKVKAGGEHSCAILDNGLVKCWGQNSFGQLGYGDTLPRGTQLSYSLSNTPFLDLGSNVQVYELELGRLHSCALLDTNSVKCWGANSSDGVLGYGDSLVRGDSSNEMGDFLPTLNLGSNLAITHLPKLGSQFSCVQTTVGPKCWGASSGFGKLGYGDNLSRGSSVTQMSDLLPAIALAAAQSALQIKLGYHHVCAILDNQQMKCWGRNTHYQLGYGDQVQRGSSANQMGNNLAEVSIDANVAIKSLSLGASTSCMLLTNGRIKCWGSNLYGAAGAELDNYLGNDFETPNLQDFSDF
ncbi:MAG: Ig-like domain repeat protein [Oligoflexales bacterium]|nr:Ig-like domain repeat protein [Oligoflexales bacterium]